jgi:uncharacterized phosphosugar-binding protein
MKRRDFFRLVPLTLPVFGGFASQASGWEKFSFGSKPLPGEPLPMVYPRRIREMLTWVRNTQSDKILEAAYAISRTVERGNRCWNYWDQGHTFQSDTFPGRIGDPEIFTTGYNPSQAKDGDLALVSFPMTPENLEDISKKEIFVIGGPCPWGGDTKNPEYVLPEIRKNSVRALSDIWIDMNVDSIGAQVAIPGSPAPLGPESGPLGSSILWMMTADACRILAKDGKPVSVRGDEPKLTEKTPKVSLAEPLMNEYYNQVIRELEMVGMELGDIGKMAGMVIDTLLHEGTVYFYSRYPESLAYEATGRRGGYAFSKPLFEGKIQGTSKDCVIMGTYQPDDEIDLKNLDAMKKLGMKTASIGPITRDSVIPSGRIVAKETMVHIGRMSDTYGFFALPGFDRKVCPTSGVLATTLLWTMCAKVAEEIISRTVGNVPAIYFNGALTWDKWWDAQVKAMMDARGY